MYIMFISFYFNPMPNVQTLASSTFQGYPKQSPQTSSCAFVLSIPSTKYHFFPAPEVLPGRGMAVFISAAFTWC